jgi:hypothetical protein
MVVVGVGSGAFRTTAASTVDKIKSTYKVEPGCSDVGMHFLIITLTTI